MTLHRRLLRLETVAGRHSLAHLTVDELDTLLRVELAAWLRDDPAPLPAEVRAEISTFLDQPVGVRSLLP
jgi:hypothetical protein